MKLPIIAGLGLSSVVSICIVAKAEIILPIRCHMGQCADYRFDRKEEIQRNENGILYKIYGAVRFTRMQTEPINNFDRPKESYVYCSRSKPMKAFDLDGRWEVIQLSPAQYEPRPDAGSNAQYWTTCHNIVGPDFSETANRSRAFKFGYSQSYETGRVKIDDIDSIFKLDNPTNLVDLSDGLYWFGSPFHERRSSSAILLEKNDKQVIAQVVYGFDIISCAVGTIAPLGVKNVTAINLKFDRRESYFTKEFMKFMNLSGNEISAENNHEKIKECKQDLLKEGIL